MSFPHLFLSLPELILSSNRQTFPHIRDGQQHPLGCKGKGIRPPGPSCKIPKGGLWPTVGPIPAQATVTRGKGYRDWPKPLLFQEVRDVYRNKGVNEGWGVMDKHKSLPKIATAINFSSFNLLYFSVILTTQLCIHSFFYLFFVFPSRI